MSFILFHYVQNCLSVVHASSFLFAIHAKHMCALTSPSFHTQMQMCMVGVCQCICLLTQHATPTHISINQNQQFKRLDRTETKKNTVRKRLQQSSSKNGKQKGKREITIKKNPKCIESISGN